MSQQDKMLYQALQKGKLVEATSVAKQMLQVHVVKVVGEVLRIKEIELSELEMKTRGTVITSKKAEISGVKEWEEKFLKEHPDEG